MARRRSTAAGVHGVRLTDGRRDGDRELHYVVNRCGFITVSGADKGIYFPLSEFRDEHHVLAEGDPVRGP